jgi:hypothetical protein
MGAALGRVRARVGVKDDLADQAERGELAGAGNEKAIQARLTLYILFHRLDCKEDEMDMLDAKHRELETK